jgi:hypothetical protein
MRRSIHARCESLLKVYAENGCLVGSDLLPGLSASELATRSHWFPGRLLDELKELYSWRNGQAGDPWLVDHVFWFRDMQFLSVERAEAEYDAMMCSYGIDNRPELDRVELRTCFPIAAFNGGWYVVPTEGHTFKVPFSAPIVSVFQGIDVHFFSLESMLDTCIEWAEASEWSDGKSTIAEKAEYAIWQKHNPGVFAGAP